MELEFDIKKEYQPSVLFVKHLSNNSELCTVCQVDEKESGQQWDLYQTKCGHVSHTRCFRRWCAKQQCLKCPLCGNIPMTRENAYCSVCKEFGHDTVGCLMKLLKPEPKAQPNRRSLRTAQQHELKKLAMQRAT